VSATIVGGCLARHFGGFFSSNKSALGNKKKDLNSNHPAKIKSFCIKRLKTLHCLKKIQEKNLKF
jgi:hypothetical protein